MSEFWGRAESKAGWPEESTVSCCMAKYPLQFHLLRTCDTGTDTEVTILYSRLSIH